MNIICLISSEPDRQIGQSEVVDSSSREVVEVVDRSTSSWLKTEVEVVNSSSKEVVEVAKKATTA